MQVHFFFGGETHGAHELLRGVCEIKVFVRKRNGGRHTRKSRKSVGVAVEEFIFVICPSLHYNLYKLVGQTWTVTYGVCASVFSSMEW